MKNMKKMLFVIFIAMAPAADAAVSAKLDLGSPAKGFIMRDAKNGQWRGGYNKNILQLNLNEKELFNVGYNHTWNTEKGNSALGIALGKHATLAQIGGLLNLSDLSLPPFLQYAGKIISLNAVLAYMPAHSMDVKGPYIYGAGAEIDMSDVFMILSRGL